MKYQSFHPRLVDGTIRSVFDQVILDVQFGEGGEDSRLFVVDLFESYCKYAQRLNLKVTKILTAEGHIQGRVEGPGAYAAFRNESGKHCVQRIPPTEVKGKRHTSMVTVAIMPVKQKLNVVLKDSDLDIKTQGGHGPGGRHQNSTDSAVRARHIPTGIEVFINGRKQHQNKRRALEILAERVGKYYQGQKDSAYDSERKSQWGGGGRSNKIRTYNFINNRVVDHRLNIKFGNVREFLKRGQFEKMSKQ